MDKTGTARSALAQAFAVKDRRVALVLYGVVVFFYWMALYLYVPTLPTYVKSRSDNLAMVGVVVSMYGLWQAVIRLPLGIVADWLGRRRPFILAGVLLAGLGAWWMGSANDVNGLIVGRAITGLAAGTWVPLVVVFSSLFPPEDAVRASAMLTLIGSAGQVIATAVNGSLNNLGGYPLAFYLAAGVAGLAFLAALPAGEERVERKPPSAASIGRLITRREVLLPSLLSTVGQYANWAATFGFLPILAKQLGASDVTLSLMISMNIVVNTLGNLLATTAVRRIGARNLTYFSFSLLALGIAAAAVIHSVAALFVLQGCIGLSMGVGYPVLMGMSIRQVAGAQRTTAMGLHQSVYAIGMFTGPWLSGILATAIGLRPMFAVTAAACFVVGMAGTHWLRES